MIQIAAEKIKKENIIAWFQSSMEWGLERLVMKFFSRSKFN